MSTAEHTVQACRLLVDSGSNELSVECDRHFVAEGNASGLLRRVPCQAEIVGWLPHSVVGTMLKKRAVLLHGIYL